MANDSLITDATVINDIDIQGGSADSLWEAGEGNGSIVQPAPKGEQVESPCVAKGVGAIAVGTDTSANSNYSHAEGMSSMTLDTGRYAGYMDGVAAHAEGNRTTAGGRASHAEGDNTVTNNIGEHAEGRYNVSHFVVAEWGNAGNTIHSVGIGTESPDLHFENSKNAFEIMQNGDAYLIGVGGYDGTNPADATRLQDAIGGSGDSGLIMIADDVIMTYDTTRVEFEAGILGSRILNEYKDNPYKYNLIVEVHGQKEDSGELFGYAANHFCYRRKQDGQFIAQCHDDLGEGISHDTTFECDADGNWRVLYSGFYYITEGQALPEEGSTVSIYLQKLR